MAAIARLLPTSLITGVARSQARRQDFATSNVRGPRTERYVSGARVDSNYPFGPVTGTASMLTTYSYNGVLKLGTLVDPFAMEQPAYLRADIEDA